MDGYISIPVYVDELIMVMDAVLSGGAGMEEGAGDPAEDEAREDAEMMILDREWLLKRYSGDTELANEIYEVFLQDVSSKQEAVHQALKAQDQDRAVKSTHSVKGMAGTIGAWKVHELALQMEKLAREGSLNEVQKSVDQFDQALAEVIEELGKG